MKNIKIVFLLIVLFGALDALYLTAAHYANVAPYCPNTKFINCVKVTTSAFSAINGVPIALMGLVWFAIIGALAILGIDDTFTNIWAMFGGAAVLYSTTGMWIIKAICIWCTAMDIMLIIILALLLFRRKEIFNKG